MSQIVVRAELLATHQWPDAPEHRKYLSQPHAHVFKFTAIAPVSHLDREIEFHDLRQELLSTVTRIAHHRLEGIAVFQEMSCEQIGVSILRQMPQLSSVIVSEDGQCDAQVYRGDEIEPPTPQTMMTEGCRVYLASASKGNRGILRDLVVDLTRRGYMVYAPCLAFSGTETPELRPHIMRHCLSTLVSWAQVLFVLDEGISSEGCKIEGEVAKAAGIPISTIKSTEVKK